jgi:hypothetical protein
MGLPHALARGEVGQVGPTDKFYVSTLMCTTGNEPTLEACPHVSDFDE